VASVENLLPGQSGSHLRAARRALQRTRAGELRVASCVFGAMRRRLSLLALLVLVLPGVCPGLEPRPDKDDLPLAWAQFRRQQIESVAYDLHITLRKDAKTFDGLATITVTPPEPAVVTNSPLSIDLKAASIQEVRINGALVEGVIERTGSFDIPAASIPAGPMTIVVDYTGDYSKTRDGLCHYRDPVDEREYLFTNLEPYGAHYVFPCFDQPDLKATYALTVTAPASWEVIGNSLPEDEHLDGANRITRFKKTPPLSTYLFFLGAGGYEVWRDEHDGLPLFLYARASLSKYLDTALLFKETKDGLDYFNRYFGIAYPFDKYAHVFAPELGPGAMENPGAVTMNEYMIFRGAPTTDNFRDRNNTLLHEMAHMWFGDLVTMAWWNDLWLNESFATFSAYQAQEAIGAYSGIWERFYQTKGWAYNQDQLSTTHPIEVAVPSAQAATANFDGITYAKGASALKQLWFMVGPEAYQRGVVQYFKEYAWQNATRAQFMASIEAQADLPLSTWTERWLQTAGLSSMTIEYDCDDGTIRAPVLRHRPVNAPVLSPHKTQIGLFSFNETGKLVPVATVPLRFDASDEAVSALEGMPCPDFLYPNYGDMDYGLFFLDERSFATALKHLSALEDPFMRRMVWGTLYSMVRHQQLRASVLMSMLIEQLPKETDPDMLEYLLGNRPTREVFRQFLSLESSLAVAPKLSALLWEGYEAAPPGTDARLHWLDAYVGTVVLPEDGLRLHGLLNLEGATALDQPRRWQVIRKLAWIGDPAVEELVTAELERDPTDQGKRYAFSIRGAIPTLDAKQAQWERLKDPELPLSLLSAGAWTFFNRLYPEITEAFVDDWFAYVASRDWEAEQHRIGLWFDELMPPVYTAEFLARSQAALAESGVPPRARRAWQESNDVIERIVAIRAFDATPEDGHDEHPTLSGGSGP